MQILHLPIPPRRVSGCELMKGRERDRQKDRKTDRQNERERERERVIETQQRNSETDNMYVCAGAYSLYV